MIETHQDRIFLCAMPKNTFFQEVILTINIYYTGSNNTSFFTSETRKIYQLIHLVTCLQNILQGKGQTFIKYLETK